MPELTKNKKKLSTEPAHTNKEINLKETRNLHVIFSCHWGATNSKIDAILSAPPQILFKIYCLLAIPYSWYTTNNEVRQTESFFCYTN